MPDRAPPIAFPRKPGWNNLVAHLHQLGVRHLTLNGPATITLTTSQLVDALIVEEDPRLRLALLPLLLTYPSLAPTVQRAIGRLPLERRDRPMRVYLAAASLQRSWRSRLAESLGALPLIEPCYESELQVPPLEKEFGRLTLWKLAADEEERYGYNALAGYTTLMHQVLAEQAVGNWGCTDARAGRSRAH